MITLLLLLYGVPVYLVFFRYKLIPLTAFWKVFLWVPPVVALVFLWFALGRYTPLAQDAYVQAPVIQVAPEVGGFVTGVLVQDNQEVKRGTPLFQIDKRPYQYKVDQAKAKVIEVQQNAAGLLASMYAAEETVASADATLLVAKKNVTGGEKDLDAAKKTAVEVAKQLQLAENEASRRARLVASNAVSREDYETGLRNVATQRTQLIDAQNRVSRAEIALEVATMQVMAAEAGTREARALRGKAEVMVDPAKTFRRVIDTKQAQLESVTRDQENPLAVKQPPKRSSALKAELDELHKYLKKAEEIGPYLQGEYSGVRSAKEALNDATLALERTTVPAPAEGVLTNLQLTEGTYARSGTPLASFIDTTRWRLIAAVPENWLEKVRPGDAVYFSLRNYPGRVRTGKVEYVGRGVVQGQGVPSGNLPDTDPRRVRQTDTPQEGQEFQVIAFLEDDQPGQPLRVGATGRMTVFASGGFPVVNELATIFHTIFSFLDYLHPKPSPLVVVLAVALVIGMVVYLRSRSSHGAATHGAP